MFKELKQTTSKELKESMRTMPHQIEDINIEIEIIKRKQIENLKLKSIIPKMQKSLEKLSNRFERAEERISELADRTIEIIQCKEEGAEKE